MRIIKKYDQYIKENKKVNEDINEIPEISSEETMEENPIVGEQPNDISNEPEASGMPGDNEEVPSEISSVDEPSEEEGHQYKGNLMLSELADKLGTEISNNSIMYNGKKINFYSETEMYHVDRKKFKTADEVVQYLNQESETPSDVNSEIEQDVEEPVMMGESKKHKSYRTTRKFESFRK